MQRQEPTHTDTESWLRDIKARLTGAVYPMNRDTAEQKLSYENIDGRDITEFLDNVNWPVRSREDLINQIQRSREGSMSSERMERIDVGEAMRKRADALVENNPDLIVRFRVYGGNLGDVGFLSILNQDERVIGVEYFESENSWKRVGSANDYRNASGHGYPVTVVIPHDTWQDFDARMQREGASGFTVYDYYSIGLMPWVMEQNR